MLMLRMGFKFRLEGDHDVIIIRLNQETVSMKLLPKFFHQFRQYPNWWDHLLPSILVTNLYVQVMRKALKNGKKPLSCLWNFMLTCFCLRIQILILGILLCQVCRFFLGIQRLRGLIFVQS